METDGDICLVIKAPYQNIDDHEILCSLDWTIQDVKQHLSVTYPNRPAVKEQKLIYTGRLLHDHLQLRDVLRPEDRQAPVHIFHLVCKFQQKATTVQAGTTFQASQSTPFSQSVNADSHTGGSFTSGENADDDDTSNLRQRITSQSNVESTTTTQTFVTSPTQIHPVHTNDSLPMQQMYVNYLAQLRQYSPVMPLSASNMPTGSAPGIMTTEELYASYYNQYMQNMQAFLQLNSMATTANVQQPSQPVADSQTGVAAPRAIPPDRNIRMNAQGGPVLDDDNEVGNGDWLDYFYLCCRGFILFSIVYFYSSPERLLLVICVAILAFLYQEGGILPRLRVLRFGGNRARQNPAPEAANNTEDVPAQNENADVPVHRENEIEAIMDADDPPHVQNPNAAENQPPTWRTFLYSFFSSLIPDQPAPVNLN